MQSSNNNEKNWLPEQIKSLKEKIDNSSFNKQTVNEKEAILNEIRLS